MLCIYWDFAAKQDVYWFQEMQDSLGHEWYTTKDRKWDVSPLSRVRGHVEDSAHTSTINLSCCFYMFKKNLFIRVHICFSVLYFCLLLANKHVHYNTWWNSWLSVANVCFQSIITQSRRPILQLQTTQLHAANDREQRTSCGHRNFWR